MRTVLRSYQTARMLHMDLYLPPIAYYSQVYGLNIYDVDVLELVTTITRQEYSSLV